MEVSVRGRNINMTDRIDQYVHKKVLKLDRYLPNIDEARVELSTEKTRAAQDRKVAQLTVRSRGTILRAEERNQDIFAAIDAVTDKMTRQISRYKTRLQRRGDRTVEEVMPAVEGETLDETEAEATYGSIVRTKRFNVAPMGPEEAIEQIELLGHDFYVFFNVETETINVLYRRQDGDFGLLQPEIG